MTVQDLRRRFLEGEGLIYVGGGQWRRPDQVLRGMDIFHDRQRFVPGGTAAGNLWMVLNVTDPGLDDCIRFCRDLADKPYSVEASSALMDVFRYMEHLTGKAERRHKDKLKTLPLGCSERWATWRPVYQIEDTELRQELARVLPTHSFWTPPCDTRDFPNLVAMIGVERLTPQLAIAEERDEAVERGESLRPRFGHAVDHLSDELARNEPGTRDKIAIGWDQLKEIPLFVYEEPICVRVSDPALPSPVLVSLKALILPEPLEIHVCDEDLSDREYGGRAIASLFPPEVRRRIDGEWALAWAKSRDTAAEAIRLASDEKRAEAMEKQAAKINAGPKGKIKVTPPASRASIAKPRTLKESVGAVAGATIQSGNPPAQTSKPRSGGLRMNPPDPGVSGGEGTTPAPIAYTNADLEQRGWEILVQALETSAEEKLVDFRSRHGVGADGVFDWKRFVEMKATARAPQVELSNNEYERAKQCGSDFILALVSGLESGQKDEVRLIFDPANSATIRPTNGVKLMNLLEAPAVIIHFEESGEEMAGGEFP